MIARANPLSKSSRLAALMVLPFFLVGCVAAGGGGSGPASPSAPGGSPAPSQDVPGGSPSPSTVPNGPSSSGGFYLRAWQTQALAPQYTFGWLAVATISDGKFIDGMVAVPAIYPGPLWIGPSVRTISAKGIDAIVAEAGKQGLLGTKTDFVETPKAGAVMGHIQLVVDGKTYELTGDPAAAVSDSAPAPGTAAAFASFWQKVTSLAMWLPDELGQSSSYEPDRLAVLALPPTQETNGITPSEVPWPLATPFSAFGTAMGNNAYRCAVVSGADLGKLEPVIKQSNQLTRFVDSLGARDSVQVRVMVPGEPNPCQ